MRETRNFLLLGSLLLFNLSVQAQTKAYIGTEGGSSFGNMFLGATGGVEVPFAKHYELDLRDTFSPLEEHIALGRGWANSATINGILWPTKRTGFDGGLTYSSYSVPTVKKKTPYVFGGLVLQREDARFTFNYIREVANGISKNGTESAHVSAGQFDMRVRSGCAKRFCYVWDFSFLAGHVLTQSNPVCDGTFGITGGPNGGPCYRKGAWGGSGTVAFELEFPRRKGD